MTGNEARERERETEREREILGREGEQHSERRKLRGSFEKMAFADLTIGLNQQHLRMS
jgi:hypothetical protein